MLRVLVILPQEKQMLAGRLPEYYNDIPQCCAAAKSQTDPL
jgi:hypothetical protein